MIHHMAYDIQMCIIKMLRYVHINIENYSKHHKIFRRLQATLLFSLVIPEIQ